MATILDVVDHTKVLIDSPVTPGAEEITGFGRVVVPMKWIALTDYKVKIVRNQKNKGLLAAWAEEGVASKWKKSSWGKKTQRKITKTTETDLQRFEAQLKAQEVAKKVRKAVA